MEKCSSCGELITAENYRINDIDGVKVQACLSCSKTVEEQCLTCGNYVDSWFFIDCEVDYSGNIRSCPDCGGNND